MKLNFDLLLKQKAEEKISTWKKKVMIFPPEIERFTKNVWKRKLFRVHVMFNFSIVTRRTYPLPTGIRICFLLVKNYTKNFSFPSSWWRWNFDGFEFFGWRVRGLGKKEKFELNFRSMKCLKFYLARNLHIFSPLHVHITLEIYELLQEITLFFFFPHLTLSHTKFVTISVGFHKAIKR